MIPRMARPWRLSAVAICVIGVSVWSGSIDRAYADEAISLFHQANQYYQAGEYAKAAETYERIRAQGQENWEIYYNLGNAYFKLHRLGPAILNYERALRLNRKHEDIQFNLDLANLSVKDRIVQPPRSLVVVWLDSAISLFSIEKIALFAVICWMATFVGLSLHVVGRKSGLRRWGRRLAWTAGSLWLVFAIVFGIQFYEQTTIHHAIVMADRVVVRSSPAEDATEIFFLHEGAKVRQQEQSGEWTRIRLADGKVGWLLTSAIETI